MTIRTRTPDTLTHTREMLESILRPHSLEELHALVGSFPFTVVKVANVADNRVQVDIAVGTTITILGYHPEGYQTDFVGRNGVLCFAFIDIKKWRLAASED